MTSWPTTAIPSKTLVDAIERYFDVSTDDIFNGLGLFGGNAKSPHRDSVEALSRVRHQGLEPRTRWLKAGNTDNNIIVIDFSARTRIPARSHYILGPSVEGDGGETGDTTSRSARGVEACAAGRI